MKKYNEREYEAMKYKRIADMQYNALALSEISLDVASVIIEYSSQSGSFEGNKEKGKLTVLPDQKFLFLINCPNGSCTD